MIPVPQQKPEKYIAMWDYEPRTQDEIELKEGHVVTVLEKCSTDWFLAEVCGRRGYIPGYYVKKVEDKNQSGDLTNELETVLLRRHCPGTMRRLNFALCNVSSKTESKEGVGKKSEGKKARTNANKSRGVNNGQKMG
ncbi:spectrin alpha chain, non-erythrocytic 1-like [Ruditapes philippinarum]|uniref:spectrin alpha chain, non-erythrocytic 1-like n=1 Tax=Ruditapes philippinarum TaxID=129788 RepID=UPI00295A9FDE|nr:spectrin alpha chain, non-erythrocytic 1-like [Ruditapes philippinarum]